MVKEIHDWNSVDEAFQSLEKANCKYAVLRSWEEIFGGEYIYCGHDIDILCMREDVDKLVKSMRLLKITGNEYKIDINGKFVSVDIAITGSGEYDPKWESDMLEHRTDFQNGVCHVLSNEDHLYMLIFHSLIEKGEFPERYHEKIIRLASIIGLKLKYEPNNSRKIKNYYMLLLYNYMTEKGYDTSNIHFNSSIFDIWGAWRRRRDKIRCSMTPSDQESINEQNDEKLMMLHIRSQVLLKKCKSFDVQELSVNESKKYLNIPDYVYDLYDRELITSMEFNEIVQLYIELTYHHISDEMLLRTARKLICLMKKYNIDC